jgi:hypothetical protein
MFTYLLVLPEARGKKKENEKWPVWERLPPGSHVYPVTLAPRQISTIRRFLSLGYKSPVT